jgi:DNA-binding transcriptional LysR family regulator
MIHLREFEAFRAVMLTGTTTAAAEALHLSQPSVSRLVADLEARLRMSLFRRERGRLVPTTEAKALLEEVERAFAALDGLSRFTGEADPTQGRPLRLVVSPGLAYRFVPQAVAIFAESFPNLPVAIDMRTAELAAELVAADQADAALALLPTLHPAVRTTPIAEAPLVCLIASTHPLSGWARLTPADLRDERLILISRRYPARTHLDRAFEAAGVQPRVSIESGTSAAACGLAAAGMGIAIVNSLMAREVEGPGMVVRPFEPSIPSEFGVLLPPRPATRVVRALIHAFKEAARRQLATAETETAAEHSPHE